MAEKAGSVNSTVYDYLKSLSNKLANQFKKQVGDCPELSDGSPKIDQLVTHYNQTSPGLKRKSNGVANGTPNKKAKMNGNAKGGSEESEDTSEDSDEEMEEPKKAMNGSAKKAPGMLCKKLFVCKSVKKLTWTIIMIKIILLKNRFDKRFWHADSGKFYHNDIKES